MAGYHPPKMITSNAAPAITSDLAYEGHGKCGCQTIVLSDHLEGETAKIWAVDREYNSGVEGCIDLTNVYKIVALENTKFRLLAAKNISTAASQAFVFGVSGFILKTNSEILANFIKIEILSGTLICYRDCQQS